MEWIAEALALSALAAACVAWLASRNAARAAAATARAEYAALSQAEDVRLATVTERCQDLLDQAVHARQRASGMVAKRQKEEAPPPLTEADQLAAVRQAVAARRIGV